MVTLKPGDRAPLFEGIDQDGNSISLKDYKGKKLVLYFYSEANSPTCTIQSCNMRDTYSELQANGFEVLGISPDTQAVQKKFGTKYNLPFRIIADDANIITNKYGVRDMKKLFGREYLGILRTTFVIDESGIILHIIHKPKNRSHGEEILSL